MAQTQLRPVEQGEINKVVSKKLFGKQHPEPSLKNMYPRTAFDIGISVLKILFFVWPVFLFGAVFVREVFKGITTGLEKGLDEALKSYRRKW